MKGFLGPIVILVLLTLVVINAVERGDRYFKSNSPECYAAADALLKHSTKVRFQQDETTLRLEAERKVICGDEVEE